MATALMLLAALERLGLTWPASHDLVVPFPQRLVAVPRRSRPATVRDRIWQEVDAVSAKLGERGRVVLRASGTEPVVRVMVEAEDEAECERALRASSRGWCKTRSGVGCVAMCGIVGYVGERPCKELLLARPGAARVPRL